MTPKILQPLLFFSPWLFTTSRCKDACTGKRTEVMARGSNAPPFNLTSAASQVPGHLFPPFLLHLISTPINFLAKQTIIKSCAKAVLFLQNQTTQSSLPSATCNTTFCLKWLLFSAHFLFAI